MTDRILLKGGTVITVDPNLGDIVGGDVLIEGDRIAEVGTGLSADAEVSSEFLQEALTKKAEADEDGASS